jgi:RHS repeat-associated protein
MVDVLTSGRSGPEAALSLQYSRARYFDLKHGRFLQRDPKGYVDGGNLYEAFGSNPARFTDPMGTFYEPWSGGPEELLVEQLFEDPEVLLVVGQGTVGVGEAIVELPVEVVVGVYTAIRHPIRTASGIGQAASTTYNNARACGDCRVVAVLQTVGAGAASVAGMGGILNAIEEPGTIREKTKEFTKGTMQLVLVAVPASKAAMAGKAGTVATTLDDIGRAGVNSLDDIGRAGVNVVDDAVRTGMGTVDDAARAAGTAPAGAVPPAMGEQLLFDFVRQDAASVAARGTRAVGSTRHIHLNPADNGAYMVLLEDGTAYIGKGGTARARQSARRASRQQNSPVDDIAHWATPDDASAFAKEAELIKSVGGKDASGLLNIINSPGKR